MSNKIGRVPIEKILLGKKSYYNFARRFNALETKTRNHFDYIHDVIAEYLETSDNLETIIGRITSNARYHSVDGDFIATIKYKYKGMKIPGWNKKACEFFIQVNHILKDSGYPTGRHAMNGGEKTFGKYSVDFYIPGYNIICEYNEAAHYTDKQKINRDLHRRWYLEIITNLPIIIIHEDNQTPKYCAQKIIDNINLYNLKIKYA
jgi:hypothetical protein